MTTNHDPTGHDPSGRTIQAHVHDDALRRVPRFFKSSFGESLSEVLQNARRSGATAVAIEINGDGDVTVTDNGRGIEDPQSLLSFGKSGWDDQVQMAEASAGMGIYALARWRPLIQSRTERDGQPGPGWRVPLHEAHFTGERAAEVERDEGAPHPHGTAVTFRASKKSELRTLIETNQEAPGNDSRRDWTRAYHEEIVNETKWYPLPVMLNGQLLEHEDFLGKSRVVHNWQGLRIGVFISPYQWGENQLNFYGKTVENAGLKEVPSLNGPGWHAGIDAAGAPKLELTLPARKAVIECAFTEEMRTQAGRVLYETMRDAGIPVARTDYEEARRLGVEMPAPPPVLSPWRPATANETDRRPPPGAAAVKVDSLRVGAELSPAEAQVLASAVANTALGSQLHESDSRLAGYGWYDGLGVVTSFRAQITQGHRIWTAPRFREVDEVESGPEGRVDTITLFLGIENAKGSYHEVQVPTDTTFWEMNEDGAPASEVTILLTEGTTATRPALEKLLRDAFFEPSDDSCSDSYETQLATFNSEATRTVAEALGEGKEARHEALTTIGWQYILRRWSREQPSRYR